MSQDGICWGLHGEVGRRGGTGVPSVSPARRERALRRRGRQIETVTQINLCTPNMSQDGICWGLHGEGGSRWMLWPCHGYIVLKKKETKNGNGVMDDESSPEKKLR
jgi:hypothetical protein